MIESDLDDTHLCIKCSSTIVGLESYIEHRKRNCAASSSVVNPNSTTHKIPTTTTANRETSHEIPTTIISTATANLDHTYEAFPFPEPEPPTTYVNKSEHGGKTSKSLTDSYDLPYELGADVFFSSLQLQSVQSTGPSTSGGKTHSSTPQIPLQRQKSSPMQQEQTENAEAVPWNVPIHAGSSSGQQNTDTLMKAVSDMSDVKKPYEVFKPITFVHESPDASEDDEPEDEHDNDAEMEEDDEDYDPIAASHATGGKWKPAPMPHSPPVVPATHTGGKWKPENRPNLRGTHTQLSRLSPNWDEQLDEAEVLEGNAEQHPPAEHTKGKWVPGTKMQRLEYKEEVVELAKSNVSHDYWCNICCRKLKSKAIYESHLRTSYHSKRAETEQQLEKAALCELQPVDISKCFVLQAPKVGSELRADGKKKRKRSATFIKCLLCKHVMLRHLVGKHLISHYHYRRMQMNPGQSLHMILDNIHSIVLQSPFQCRPCRFYANTEETFLKHWNSPEHLDLSEGPGKFWCSYCNFECEDNNQMRRHLLSWDHKEVILAINRSVPICISKKLALECAKCRQTFRYNIELRKHMQLCHPGIEDTGTASDNYQSRYNCNLCPDSFPSCVALQRHEKNRHSITKYFCSICKQQFSSACQARRHRKTLAHRICAASAEKRISIKKQKSLQTKGVKNSRECNKCGFVATSEVEAMLHELSHSKSDFNSSSTIVSAKASTSKRSAETTPRKMQASAIKPETPIKCKDCTEVLESVTALKLHRDSEHPLLCHVCMSCGQSFARSQALGQHSRVCKPASSTAKASEENTAAKSWNCEKCGFKAIYESELIFHRLFHIHGPISKNHLIQCPLCTKEFRKDSLRCHLRLHTNEKIFECQFCNLKFSRRHNLTEHINKLHKKAEAEPDKVRKKHKDTKETTAMDEKPTTSKAAAAATNAAEKKRAAAVKKQKENYQCDTCGKVFTLKNSLKMHSLKPCLKDIKGDLKLRKYVCTHEGCDYAATTNAILGVHMVSHSQEVLKCKHANCKYTGKSMRHLKRHLSSHKEASKRYACDCCDFKSSIKGHLLRHIISHSGVKPHQCPHCDYRCSTLDNLRKHVLKTNKHTGKFIYECEQCAQQQYMETEMEIAETITIFKTNSYHEYQLHLNDSHASNKNTS